jgi:hypothetical protein
LVVISAAAAPALLSCAGSRGRDSFRPEPIAGDQAAVYIYRARSMGAPVRVALDQQDAGELRGGEYLVRIVKPGEHIVRVEGASVVALSAELVPGDVAYFEITTKNWGKHPAITTPEEAVARGRIAGAVRVP